MNIKCKIIEVYPEQRSVTVRYYSDTASEDSLASDFNPDGSIMRRPDGTPWRCKTDIHQVIWAVPVPQGQALHDWLFANCPPNKSILALQEKINNKAVDDISTVSVSIGVEKAYVQPVIAAAPVPNVQTIGPVTSV